MAFNENDLCVNRNNVYVQNNEITPSNVSIRCKIITIDFLPYYFEIKKKI